MFVRHIVQQFARQYAQQRFQTAVADQLAGSGDGQTIDATDFEIAVVFALGIESGGLVDCLDRPVSVRHPSFVQWLSPSADEPRITIIETGVGRERAARATGDLIDVHRPRWIVSAGLAGALQPDLRRGNVVMPNEIVDQHGDLLSVGFSLPDGAVETTPGLKVGRLLTVDHLIRDPDEKRQLGAQHHAIACDMETMAVAQVCQERRIRFLAVRIISDTLDDRLPREIEQVLDQTTWAAKMGAATGALFRRPSSAKDLWKLREIALKASDKLARFLKGILPQLAERDAT